MSQSFNPVPITLKDGKERFLEYSLGTCRRIRAKYITKPEKTPDGASQAEQIAASALGQILEHDASQILPELIYEGLTDKEGLTPEKIGDELLTGPMIEDAQLAFVEAFFGSRERRWLGAFVGIRTASIEQLEERLKPKAKEPETQGLALVQ